METNVTLSRSAVVDASARIAHDVFIGEKVSIGALSYVNVGTWVQSGSIGKYCSIAPGCYIGGGNHAIEYVSTSQRTYWADGQKLWGEFLPFENIEHPPQIGNDVWIGAHAIILQRVTIGDGAVVAAGSIVTKDVPPYSIVAGNPARVVKMRFSEEKIDYLTKLRWWDLDQSELKKLGPMFLAGKEWYHSRPTGQEDCSP